MYRNDNKSTERLTELPVELYPNLIFYLDVKEILALRKTCKHFFAVTHDRGLWMTLFDRLRTTMPLPCSETEFKVMSTLQAERTVFAALNVESRLLVPRDPECIPLHVGGQRSSSLSSMPPLARLGARRSGRWRALSFVSERFVLAVDHAAVNVWDVSVHASGSDALPEPWAHFDLANFVEHAVHDSTLYIAAASGQGDHQSVVIYYVPLPPLGVRQKHNGRLHIEAKFPLRESEQLRYMDPSSGRALLYCPPNRVDVVHWSDGNRRTTISIRQSDVHDEQRHGITALRICGPFMLCFGLRSLAAYPIPNENTIETGTESESTDLLVHQFGQVKYGHVSLSHVRWACCPLGETYTLYMLACDKRRGLSHYCVRVQTQPVPSLRVRAVAQLESIRRRPAPLVPAWSLGADGLHGVWVNGERGGILQRVMAFTTRTSRLRFLSRVAEDVEESTLDVASEEAPNLKGEWVYQVPSKLSDGIAICAMSGWNGRIALGSFEGDLLVL